MFHQSIWKTFAKTYVVLFQQYLKDHPRNKVSYGLFFLLGNHFIYIMHRLKIWLCAAVRSIYTLAGQSGHSSDE